MPKHSLWWCFLFAFMLLIGGIQTLGWWSRSSASEPTAPSAQGSQAMTGAPLHWRDLLMHP